jgi:16S rRNA (cytidine1402-2'-O)-methyltransferase
LEREQVVQGLVGEPRAVVLLEAPHRIEALAKALEPLGERPLTVAREISKQFEQIATLPAKALSGWLTEDTQRARGEFVLVLHPQPRPASEEALDAKALKVLDLLLAELPTKTAVKLAAEITNAPRNALYAEALKRRA